MSSVELTPEMKQIEYLERECRQLRHIVECLMITREGIPELDGQYITLYDEANKYLTGKTFHLRDRKIRDKEKAELEQKIRELQERLMTYD